MKWAWLTLSIASLWNIKTLYYIYIYWHYLLVIYAIKTLV